MAQAAFRPTHRRDPHLSQPQAAQLEALRAAAAISEGFARSPRDLTPSDPAILAELQRQGLVGRRMVRIVRGGVMPLYWLTPTGLAQARNLAQPRVPPPAPTRVQLELALPPSRILFGYDRDPPAVRLLSDELGSRPIVAAARRLELAPETADQVMRLVAGAVSALCLVGMAAGWW